MPLLWYLCKYFIKLALVVIRTLIRIINSSNNRNLCSNFRFPQLFFLLLLTITPENSNGFCNRTQVHVDIHLSYQKENEANDLHNKQILNFRCIQKGWKLVLMRLGNIASVPLGMLFYLHVWKEYLCFFSQNRGELKEPKN